MVLFRNNDSKIIEFNNLAIIYDSIRAEWNIGAG